MTGSGGPPGPAQFLKPIQDAIQRSTFNHQAWLAFWQQQMAEGFKTLQAMAFCRSPAEVAELHAAFVRESAVRAKTLMHGGATETGVPPVTAPAPPVEPAPAPEAAPEPAKAEPEPAAEPSATAPIPEAPEAAEAAKAAEATADEMAAQMSDAPEAAGEGPPDDLKRIHGIGPAAEKTLIGLGITRFAQIAAFGPEDIERVEEHLRFKGRIERDDWVGQAKALQQGG